MKNTTRLASGRVVVTKPNQVSSDRYEFLDLASAEPNLGTAGNGQVLVTNTVGTRTWSGNLSIGNVTLSDDLRANVVYTDYLFYANGAAFTGAIGYAGSAGSAGYTGSQGTGFTGSAGYTGSVGFVGSRGETGPQGIAGEYAAVGYTGSQGIQGIQGSLGYTGSQGDRGPDFSLTSGDIDSLGTGSHTWTVNKTASNSAYQVGNYVYVFAVSSSFGYYMYGQITDYSGTSLTVNVIDHTGNGTYGGWRFVLTSQIGYTGSRGSTGFTGSQGAGFTGSRGAFDAVGFTGSQGELGYTGSRGAYDAVGFTGSQGELGYFGSQGDPGYTGSIGYTGSQGIPGEAAAVGFTGSVGYVGSIGYTGSQGIPGEYAALGYTGSRGDLGYVGSIGYTGSTSEATSVTLSPAFKGALLYLSGNFAITTGWMIIDQFNSVSYDTNGFSGGNGRIYIPAGVSKVKLYASLSDNNAIDNVNYMVIAKNGDTSYYFSGAADQAGVHRDLTRLSVMTAVIPVSAGDYFEVAINCSGSATLDPGANNWFSVEVFEGGILDTTSVIRTTGYTGSASTAPGYTGSIGYTGSQGIPGEASAIGYTGSRGNLGYVGSQGVTGFTGSRGELGYLGSIGYTGSAGAGYTGSSGTFIGTTANQIITSNTTAATSTTTGALQVAGGVGVQGNVFAGAVYTEGLFYANGQPFVTGTSGSTNIYNGRVTATNSQTLIDSLSVTDIDTVKWILSAKDTVNGDYKSSSIDSNNDGINVFYTEYGIVLSDPANEVANYAISISAGNISLYATGTSSSVPVTFQRITLGAGTVQGNVQGVSYLSGTTGSGTATVVNLDTFTGNGVATAYTLSVTPSTKNQTFISIGGILQPKNTYSLAGAVITFSSAPPADAPIEIQTFVTTTVTGYTGSAGPQGSQGIIGYTGSAGTGGGGGGYTGSAGTIGYTGSAGINGFTGSVGIAGYTGSAGTLTNWSKKTANYTAVSGDRLIADTNGGSFVITLPGSPNLGDLIKIADGNDFSINPVTVAANGNTIESQSSDVIVDIGKIDLEFIYDGSTWQIISTMGPIGYTGSAGGFSGTTTSAIITSNTASSTSTTTGALQIAGGAGIVGNVNIGGTLYVSSNIVPTTDGTVNLGSPTARFGTLYISANTIDIGGATISGSDGSIQFGTNSGNVTLNSNSISFLSNVSSQGPEGARGFTGSAGTQGTQGYTGSAGVGYTGSAAAGGPNMAAVFGHTIIFGF